jgi:hypothetical protein
MLPKFSDFMVTNVAKLWDAYEMEQVKSISSCQTHRRETGTSGWGEGLAADQIVLEMNGL